MRERANLLFRIRRSWFGLRLRFAASRLGRRRYRASRFLFVAPHHQLADPSIALDIMAGQIVLAGRMLMTHGRQPFTMDAPSRGFAAALAGFQWLAHFDASDRGAVRAYPRVLVQGFMQRRESDERAYAENPSTIARRVISWLTHSSMLTLGCNSAFYRTMLDHLARDCSLLLQHYKLRENGMARLDAALALLFHALCVDLSSRAVLKAELRLAKAISATVLPDGMPKDRNAATALRIAADLDPIAALYRARQMATPSFIGQTLARLISALRLHRHPDGGLALFNGAGLASRDLVSGVLSIQKGAQAIPNALPDGGFERLENASCLLIADTGAAFAPAFGHSAGASALAFEFSTRMDRVIVNCGVPVAVEGDVALAWRGGPAHSSLLIEEQGAGRFVSRPNLRGVRDDLYVRADQPQKPVRRMGEEGEVLILGHSAFRAEHGYLVERQLTLLNDGEGLLGLDRFIEADAKKNGNAKTARLVFHLHPQVKAIRLSEGNAIVLRLPREPAGRDLWVFEVEGLIPELEESRCFESEAGTSASEQITVALPLSGNAEILWRLQPYAPKFG